MVGLMLIGSLISCSDSGGPLAEGGIGGTGISSGTITGFGSIFVNGVEFNTEDAVITVDGDLANESDLGIGMVVAVEGSYDQNGLSGTANRITYDEILEGTVDAIDIAAESLVVLGQSVFTNKQTVFEGASFDALTVGNIVEISGFTTSSGAIQATRIEFKSQRFILSTTELEITGTVANLDESTMTFMIGDLVIDFSNAVLSDLPDGRLTEGSVVAAESSVERVNGVLVANRVEGREISLADFGGLRFEIEGVVTDFTSPSDFEVNGILVRTDANTLFENGTSADIALDTKLEEVEGILDANGVLFAAEIEFDLDATVEIEADVQAVDSVNRELVLLGITVTVNNRTVIFDGSDAAVRPFGLEDIRIGDRVVVIGNPMGGIVTAIRLERMNPAFEVGLEGPVSAIAPPTFEILGVTVETTNQTDFKDANDVPIAAAEFFAAVQIGSIAGAEGTLASGNVIVAREAELDN